MDSAKFLANLCDICEDSSGGVVVVAESPEDAAIVSRMRGKSFLKEKTNFVVWLGKDFSIDNNTPHWWWDNLDTYRRGMREHSSTFRDAVEATEVTVQEIMDYTRREPVSLEAIYELLS